MKNHETLSEYISDLERALLKDDMEQAVKIEAAMIAFHMTKVEAARLEGEAPTMLAGDDPATYDAMHADGRVDLTKTVLSAEPPKRVMMCDCGAVLENPAKYAEHCEAFPSHFNQT